MLILCLPLLLLVGVINWLLIGPPILFRQERPGLGGKPFQIMKFRTMREGSSPDSERLTRIGQALRALSLDELPELWNVVKGDMSLVGPRPLLTHYLDRYNASQARRHEVKPGITGWAQVNGRNAPTWEEKLALDVWYVDHRSFLLDIKILARTVVQVILRKGIVHPGAATMPEFIGTRANPDTEEGP
jgi:lipopolysaccharide/colanic/teichoic acid biosynthesis glycosyltransferase